MQLPTVRPWREGEGPSVMRVGGGAFLALIVATGALAVEHNPTLSDPDREVAALEASEAEPTPATESFLPDTTLPTPVAHCKDRFPSGRDKVAVDIFRPRLDGRLPVVLLFHGAHPKKAEKHYLRMAEDLASHGYLSLYVRYYERGRKGRGVRSQWRATVHDAVTFASGLDGADPERLGVVGYSLGAFLTLGRAPLDERIRAVVAYYGGISRDLPPALPNTAPPTLLLHGTYDRIVPFRRSVEVFEAIRDAGRVVDLVVYPGARHGFCLNGRGGIDGGAATDAWSRTLAFLDFHLQREAPQDALRSTPFLEEPPCSSRPSRFSPVLSHPPRYLAPMDVGSPTTRAFINPSREEVTELVAAAAKARAASHRSAVRRRQPAKHGIAKAAPSASPLAASPASAKAPEPIGAR